MLYRLGIAAIVVFWLTMWTLFIRSEVHPGESGLREVPAEVVLRQFFHPEQSSDLYLYDDGTRMGHVRLSPRINPKTGLRELEFFGNSQIDLPDGLRNRAFWNGEVTVNKDFAVELVHAEISVRNLSKKGSPQTAPIRVEFQILPAQKTGSYSYSEENAIVSHGNFTLDEAGVTALLETWGVPTDWRKQMPTKETVKPTVNCRLARIKFHDTETDVYHVEVASNGQTLLELEISQLGQVLDAKTPFGWSLNID